jgi:hypothetical protein
MLKHVIENVKIGRLAGELKLVAEVKPREALEHAHSI